MIKNYFFPMEDIKKIIKEKEDKIINIDKEINATIHINIKEQLLNEKNKLINDKIQISEILLNYNDTTNNNLFRENSKKTIKRKNDYLNEENDSSMEISKEEEIEGILKDGKGNRKIIYKNSNQKNIKNEKETKKQNNPNNSIKVNEIKDKNENANRTLKKNYNKKNNIINNINKKKKINNENILDQIDIDKEFDFNKFNYNYSWKDEDFITIFTKKYETKNNVYLFVIKGVV